MRGSAVLRRGEEPQSEATSSPRQMVHGHSACECRTKVHDTVAPFLTLCRCPKGNPHDALRIAADVGCKQAYATHWGTWCMSDERWDEPLVDLEAALHQEGIARDYLVTLPFGKTVEVQ